MILFCNEVAKQEAFEEKIRLKNQFRALDEDEVDFLDSVLESTRAQEAAVKKDTAEQLEVFRKQREEAEKAMLGSASSEVAPVEEEEWTIPARKRRRDKGKDLLLPGKKRKASAAEESGKGGSKEGEARKSSQGSVSGPVETERQPASTAIPGVSATKAVEDTAKGPTGSTQKPSTEPQSETKPPAKPSVGLVGYGSDSDSE